MKQLAGVFNVISTPIDNSDEIDQKTLKKEIDWLIKCGSNGTVLAMVSEVLRFSASERRKQWQLSLEYLSNRIPLVVSVGAESSAIAVGLAKDAQKDGATSHQHDGEDSHDHPAIGEIYITAVDPSFNRVGVGKALTTTALNYLKYQGLNQVILYVDEENKAAINLYQSLGFKEFGKDLLFKLP